MSQRFEFNNVGGNIGIEFRLDDWPAQSFVPRQAHTITSVKLQLSRYTGFLVGTITVGIRETGAVGRPTLVELCSGTTDGDTLPEGGELGGFGTWEWREITLGAGFNLVKDTEYAIVVRAVGPGRAYWRWINDNAYIPLVGLGYPHDSSDAGVSWSTINPWDTMFEEWGELIVAPTVTTDPATGVTNEQAILNGTLDNDGEEACDCGFEWGETISYGNTTPTTSQVTGESFSQTIVGLDRKKTYHFRAFATNPVGTSHGSDVIFNTLAELPTTTTDPATGVSTANGTLDDDGGEACDCGFEWGPTVAYGNTTPTQSRNTGGTFSQTIGGLTPGATYHFRSFATNSFGTGYGADRTFIAPGGLAAVATDPASARSRISAALNGTLDDDGGETCSCGFEWGLDTGYGLTTPTESKVTGETFSQPIEGLFPDTTYYFRAFATNSFGTAYGANRSITTAPTYSKSYALAREEL